MDIGGEQWVYTKSGNRRLISLEALWDFHRRAADVSLKVSALKHSYAKLSK